MKAFKNYKGDLNLINELDVIKAKKGDKESFYNLIKPIELKLYKIAFIYMKNENDALDMLQDSIVKSIESLNKLKNPKSFNFWITKILINNCKETLKKQNHKVITLEDCSELLAFEDKSLEDADELYTALNSLNEKEREIIIMRYLKDMALMDISTEKSMPLGTVKSIVNRSLKKLKKSFKRRY